MFIGDTLVSCREGRGMGTQAGLRYLRCGVVFPALVGHERQRPSSLTAARRHLGDGVQCCHSEARLSAALRREIDLMPSCMG